MLFYIFTSELPADENLSFTIWLILLTGILSFIMALVGFFCVILLPDFKQFSLLFPVIMGLGISLLSGVNFLSVSETAFYALENNLSDDTVQWLQMNGKLTVFPNMASLENAVNDLATQGIGVVKDGTGIKTFISGDELQINTVIGNTLPNLYAERNKVDLSRIIIIPAESKSDSLTSLLIVITLVTAMFMGCTFNAMSIISEKEDGISFINEVLPMTKREYVIQKIALGFMGGVLSTILTALVCMKITFRQVMPLLLLVILCAFVAALIGLIIGCFSNGLMTGIVYIKVIMILFLAPPILCYLTVPSESLLYSISYLLPSSAAFYGLMDVLNGQPRRIGLNIIILFAHGMVWLLLFFSIARSRRRSAALP